MPGPSNRPKCALHNAHLDLSCSSHSTVEHGRRRNKTCGVGSLLGTLAHFTAHPAALHPSPLSSHLSACFSHPSRSVAGQPRGRHATSTSASPPAGARVREVTRCTVGGEGRGSVGVLLHSSGGQAQVRGRPSSLATTSKPKARRRLGGSAHGGS